MTTTTFTSQASTASDALFRNWGSTISAALAAIGMVQTSDTGQINWATVPRPAGAANVIAGYEIWRFNDALQSSAPIFFKLEYSCGSSSGSSSTNANLWLTVGKSTDGAGNITGVVLFARTSLNPGNAVGTLSSAGYGSSGDGSMCAILPCTGGDQTSPSFFIIDRSRDSAGVRTADGIIVVTPQPSSAPVSSGAVGMMGCPMRAIAYSTGNVNAGRVPVTLPKTINGVSLGASSSLAVAAVAPVFPWTAYAPGTIPWQVLAALSWVDDPGGLFTARILGADRTYRSIPLNNAYMQFGLGMDAGITGTNLNSGYVGVAILWQ